jgi:hypothetical protein
VCPVSRSIRDLAESVGDSEGRQASSDRKLDLIDYPCAFLASYWRETMLRRFLFVKPIIFVCPSGFIAQWRSTRQLQGIE